MAAFGVLLSACIIAFGLLIHFKIIANPFNSTGGRQGAVEFSLTREERLASLQTGGSYSHEFTSRAQAVDTYERAISFFNTHRDEAARVNLNRILESNADDTLKNRALFLLSYLEAPTGFDNFRRADNIAFSTVENDPFIYRDVHVIWQGSAVNVQTNDQGTSFELLVGNDPRHLEGIAHVRFDHAVPLNLDRRLEVLGRIVLVENDRRILLEGLAIHQSARLEN